ncbi:MAG TPA: protein kinase [Candidatus Acidoferrales bacterium]|nr:protein kinase [Candidatus Acidoferrales bacterium]
MPLSSGARLGPYEVAGVLGAGGMGEVYRARDTRLGRDVALKVLPEEFAADPDRMARFEREAKLLASLNHPNIAAVFGLEESSGIRALVMELVEGPTLADRVQSGALPLDEALPVARQVAEALEYAHERGVVHRDLKPANIKLRPDGAVKVLDFGLAKALEGDAPQADASHSPTLSRLATQAGIILGTAAYMAPEQAKGKAVDRRADVWAFGCVLFEMIAGKPAFGGETVTDTLAEIIKGEPEWSALPPSTPPRIRALLVRCLEKDPRQRLQAIGEARIAIAQTLAGKPEPAESPALAPTAPLRRRALPWAAGIALAIAVGVVVWELRPQSAPPPIVEFSLAPPEGASFLFHSEAPLALSPDGAELAFRAERGSALQIFLGRLDHPGATPVPGTDGADDPFFSPNGQWIGFFAGGKLKKASVSGGEPVTLCDAPKDRGGAWAPDDTIIFAPDISSGLMRIPAAGGTPQPITAHDSGRRLTRFRWPQILPGGKELLVSSSEAVGSFFQAEIAVLNLETGKRKILPVRGAYPRYVAGGYLVYAQAEGLFAVPFDLDRLAVTGSPARVLGVLADGVTGAAAYAVSDTGSLVYLPGGARVVGRLAWVDRKGAIAPLAASAEPYNPALRLSPNGNGIALVLSTSVEPDIWVYDLARGTLTRLTFGGAVHIDPIWSPDGRHIAFARFKDGLWSIVSKRADGSGAEETLPPGRSANRESPGAWSPDSKYLAYNLSDKGLTSIWAVPLAGGGKPQPVVATQFNNRSPALSPDGKWLAYVSDESGSDQIYVVPFPSGTGKWQVSTGGGVSPVWARNGKELFYRTSDGAIMGVDVSSLPAFRASVPRAIANPPGTAGAAGNFDVSPDGQRFLIHLPPAQGASTLPLDVILNWSEVLRRQFAAAR